MRLTRVYRFAASHRLHSTSLTCEQNLELYGKCNNPYGHGHNYVLHVSVAGVPDATTGRVVDTGALDEHVREKLLRLYDHADLNTDVPDFAGVPTTENLAADAEKRLRHGWPFADASLDRVLIQETDRNTVEMRVIELRNR